MGKMKKRMVKIAVHLTSLPVDCLNGNRCQRQCSCQFPLEHLDCYSVFSSININVRLVPTLGFGIKVEEKNPITDVGQS